MMFDFVDLLVEIQYYIEMLNIQLFEHNYKILFFVDIIDEKISIQLNHFVQFVHYPKNKSFKKKTNLIKYKTLLVSLNF